MNKILKILLIVLGVLVLAFVGLVIYEVTIGLPESSSEVLPPTLPSEEAKKPAPCFFTREPEETWPDETVSDPPIGNVELIKKFRFETYDVFGSNMSEVRDSMIKNGPATIKEKWPTFNRSSDEIVALGGGVISGKWYRKNTIDGCVFTRAEETVNIILLLPKWADKASASDQDQKMWDLYLEFLKRHEQGHINIALKEARELQVELAQPKSAPSCQELDDKMNTLFAVSHQKLKEATDNYDNRTNRGSTQMPHEINQTPSVFPFTCDWSEIKI